jgi:superfamily II DNA/RNA helicase
MPAEIRRITEQFLHNPVRVEVSKPATTVATTSQFLARTGREPHDKRDTLRQLIRSVDGFKNGTNPWGATPRYGNPRLELGPPEKKPRR